VAAAGFDAPARPPQPLVGSFTILPAADPLAAAEAYVAERPALTAFLSARPWRRELARLFEAFGTGLSARLARQPSLWTHNDWHPSNLLWAPDGTVETVFDFGLATRTCALHDLAIAIERTAFDWLHLDDGPQSMAGDADAARALVEGYDEVLPLGAADVETIARMLPLVHVEFALSEIDYFHGVVADRDAAVVAWDDYLIGHAEWFGSRAGRDFLDRFVGGRR
jgi:Ser/Thr protein kinase RdoA (MazF antagonist)